MQPVGVITSTNQNAPSLMQTPLKSTPHILQQDQNLKSSPMKGIFMKAPEFQMEFEKPMTTQ